MIPASSRGPPFRAPVRPVAQRRETNELQEITMSKLMSRTAFLALLLVGLAALPAAAQIPAGFDPWVTPANGQTFTEFAKGDVEALCGKPDDPTWNHTVVLKGVPGSGVDYDTVVQRIDNVTFNTSGVGTTRVQVVSLAFKSIAPTSTPCGDLDWTVGLTGTQPVTKMTITKTSSTGGLFYADLVVNVEMKGYKKGTTTYVGSVFYSINLPQGSTGTPWSFDRRTQAYRPGITDTDDCIAALRVKLTQYPTTSKHYYFISDLIAAGKCNKG